MYYDANNYTLNENAFQICKKLVDKYFENYGSVTFGDLLSYPIETNYPLEDIFTAYCGFERWYSKEEIRGFRVEEDCVLENNYTQDIIAISLEEYYQEKLHKYLDENC